MVALYLILLAIIDPFIYIILLVFEIVLNIIFSVTLVIIIHLVLLTIACHLLLSIEILVHLLQILIGLLLALVHLLQILIRWLSLVHLLQILFWWLLILLWQRVQCSLFDVTSDVYFLHSGVKILSEHTLRWSLTLHVHKAFLGTHHLL